MLKRIAIAVVVIVVAGAGWLWWRSGAIGVERITDSVYMLSGIGGNVGVLGTEDGVIVVDTMTFVRQGEAIEAKIRDLLGKPVAAIVNTHYHLDHTHGNPAFVPGTKVVSTESTLGHLKQLDGDFWADAPARDLLPNDTFETEHVMKLGGKTVRSLHVGRGHTDGDLVALFVEDRVLVAGDLIFNGFYPNIDLEAGGSAREWPETMEKLFALDFDKVIPGHGPVTDRQGLRRFQEFMRSLWTQTKAVTDRGGSLEEAKSAVALEPFDLGVIWYVPYLNRSFVIERAYEEATRGG